METLLIVAWVVFLSFGPVMAMVVPLRGGDTVPARGRRLLVCASLLCVGAAWAGVSFTNPVANHLWLMGAMGVLLLASCRVRSLEAVYLVLSIGWTICMALGGWAIVALLGMHTFEPDTDTNTLGHGFVARQRTYGILGGSGYEVRVTRRLGLLPLQTAVCSVRFRAMGPWPGPRHPSCTVRTRTGQTIWTVRPIGDAFVRGLDAP